MDKEIKKLILKKLKAVDKKGAGLVGGKKPKKGGVYAMGAVGGYAKYGRKSDMPVSELRKMATAAKIPGRSKMDKAELILALEGKNPAVAKLKHKILQRGKPKQPRKQTAWMKLVKDVRAANPQMAFKDVLKLASTVYRQ